MNAVVRTNGGVSGNIRTRDSCCPKYQSCLNALRRLAEIMLGVSFLTATQWSINPEVWSACFGNEQWMASENDSWFSDYCSSRVKNYEMNSRLTKRDSKLWKYPPTATDSTQAFDLFSQTKTEQRSRQKNEDLNTGEIRMGFERRWWVRYVLTQGNNLTQLEENSTEETNRMLDCNWFSHYRMWRGDNINSSQRIPKIWKTQ